MSPPPDRSERLSVRMSKTEMDMLEKLADAKGVSASDVVRLFIREAHAQQFPEPSSGRQPPKKKVEKIDGEIDNGTSKDMRDCTCWVSEALRVLGYAQLTDAIDHVRVNEEASCGTGAGSVGSPSGTTGTSPTDASPCLSGKPSGIATAAAPSADEECSSKAPPRACAKKRLEDLYPRVTEAIERADAHLAAGRSVDARAAYLEVSMIEEEIAANVAAYTSQGAIARCGAVSAAVDAEQHLRARELATRYLADPGLPADDQAELLQALAAAGGTNIP